MPLWILYPVPHIDIAPPLQQPTLWGLSETAHSHYRARYTKHHASEFAKRDADTAQIDLNEGLTLRRSFRPRIKRDQKHSTPSRGRPQIVFDEGVQLSA